MTCVLFGYEYLKYVEYTRYQCPMPIPMYCKSTVVYRYSTERQKKTEK